MLSYASPMQVQTHLQSNCTNFWLSIMCSQELSYSLTAQAISNFKLLAMFSRILFDILDLIVIERKVKKKNWAENDYYDSDEDTFLDRTGLSKFYLS